jgi:hypothetical protein
MDNFFETGLYMAVFLMFWVALVVMYTYPSTIPFIVLAAVLQFMFWAHKKHW